MDPSAPPLVPVAERLATYGPLPLTPCTVAKPWGHEVWHTGMEARGTATIGGVPLMDWLMCDPTYMLGRGNDLTLPLLKCLCTRPLNPFGDLYLEVHRQKWEVYVVSRVDNSLWPGGVGEVVWGLNGTLFRTYDSPLAFLKDFGQTLKAYESLRQRLDGFDTGHGEATSTHPPVAEEVALRQKVLSFTGRLQVQVGDVVPVPAGVPHCLRHGVEVVEFQTPVYERLILAFWQKVLTQNTWDVEEGLGEVDIAASLSPPTPLPRHLGVERVVDFPGFWVDRWSLGTAETASLSGGRARVVYTLQGSPTWVAPHGPPGGWPMPGPGAWLLPAGLVGVVRGPGVFLVGAEHT